MAKLAPSILSADFSDLGRQVALVEEAGAELLHVDVMDGHFVPNLSFGADVMKSLLGKTALPLDVHLMVERPDDILESFVTEQTAYITVHQEACVHLDRTLEHIRSCGVKAGVSLNPATPLSQLENLWEKLDLVLIMSVNPGFGGQRFIPYSLQKIEEVKKIKEERGLPLLIEVDGGVHSGNAEALCRAGTDILVAGSAIFAAEDIGAAVKELLEKIR